LPPLRWDSFDAAFPANVLHLLPGDGARIGKCCSPIGGSRRRLYRFDRDRGIINRRCHGATEPWRH